MGSDHIDVVERVLAFWFAGDFDAKQKAWFIKDPAYDENIRQAFGSDVEKAALGEYDHLVESANGALALMILLDQFPRNLYRNDAKTFASDPKALELAKIALGKGHDAGLTPVQKIFFYLPFEHCENLEEQERAVELCEALGDADYLKYAIAHRDVIAKFGRFPHRNEVLGRVSSQQEIAHLEANGGF